MHIGKISAIKPLLGSLIWLAIILFVILFMVGDAFAQETTPVAPGDIIVQQPTPVVSAINTNITDDQVNAIAKQLFCPVCENIPLDVCPTQACAQWRELIREKLAAGWNEKQIKNYFVDQYGERVLGAPQAKGINWLVYVVPPLAILGGMLILYRVLRSWKPKAGQNISAQTGKLETGIADTGESNPEGQADEYVRRLEEELRQRE